MQQGRDLRQNDDQRAPERERRAAAGPRRLVDDRRDPPENEEVNEHQLLVEVIRTAERARDRQQELYDRELAAIGKQLEKLGEALDRERRWRAGLMIALLVVAFLADPAAVVEAVAMVVKAL